MTDINNRITIILGAGASSEVGLPVGSELKDKITNLLDIRYEDGITQSSGNREIDTAFRIILKGNNENDINPYLQACHKICNAMPQAISIDSFIDAHAGDLRIETAGKLGVTKAILDAERASTIYIDRLTNPNMIDFERVKDTWFNKFFQLLTENCRLEDVPGRLSSVKIISFNYDRCIAHYIYFALQNYFGVDHNQAAELLSNLEIFHPYGKVGELPWQNDGTDSTEFGAEIPSQKLLTISTQIRTFTEGTNPETSNIKALRQSIVDSNTLIFLGFAYHRLNLNLLKSQQTSGAPRSAYGTAYGLSVPNCEEIKYEVTNLVGKAIGNPQIKNNLKCGQLFDEYSRVMSMV